jgi:hypothetical protein
VCGGRVPVAEVNDHNINNEVQQTVVSLADLIQHVKEQLKLLLKQTSVICNDKIAGNLESVASKPAVLGRPHFDKFNKSIEI